MSVSRDYPQCLLIQPMPGRSTVAVGFWLSHGAAHDSDLMAGATHMVEHLSLRRCGRRSRRQLAALVDRLGGDVDAWTSSEAMGITIQTTPGMLSEALELLRDAALEPSFAVEDVDLERRVSRAEMELLEDDPVEKVEDAILQAAWGDHSLARPIIGYRATLDNLVPERLRDHHRSLLRPGRALAAVAGDVDADQVASILEPLPLDEVQARPPLAPLDWKGNTITIRRAGVEQVHARLAFEALPVGDPSECALAILNRILGVGASSRLFQSLREEAGLTYEVWSSLILRSLGGVLEVGWTCHPDVFPETWDMVQSEIENILDRIDQSEVEIAKEGLERGILIEADSTAGRCCLDAAEYMERGRRFNLVTMVDEVREVEVDDVRRMARRILDRERLAIAICGPEDFDWSPRRD